MTRTASWSCSFIPPATHSALGSYSQAQPVVSSSTPSPRTFHRTAPGMTSPEEVSRIPAVRSRCAPWFGCFRLHSGSSITSCSFSTFAPFVWTRTASPTGSHPGTGRVRGSRSRALSHDDESRRQSRVRPTPTAFRPRTSRRPRAVRAGRCTRRCSAFDRRLGPLRVPESRGRPVCPVVSSPYRGGDRHGRLRGADLAQLRTRCCGGKSPGGGGHASRLTHTA